MNPCICCNTETVAHAFMDQFLGNRLRRCPACHHVQLAVAPSTEVVAAYYRESYSRQRGSYVDDAYARIMKKRARAQIDFMRPFANFAGARICDVGCGYGYLLEALQGRSGECWGVEYDPATVEACRQRGLSVEQISSEADLAKLPDSDLVILSHCLEHFAVPGKALKLIARTSNVVFIEVPVYDAGLDEQFADQLGHMNFFNRHSLLLFLERNGFEVLDCDAFGPSVRFFYSAKWTLPRKVWRRATRDYFLNGYSSKNPDGIWLRAMVRLKESV